MANCLVKEGALCSILGKGATGEDGLFSFFLEYFLGFGGALLIVLGVSAIMFEPALSSEADSSPRRLSLGFCGLVLDSSFSVRWKDLHVQT
jgi:hypothetical protein